MTNHDILIVCLANRNWKYGQNPTSERARRLADILLLVFMK